MSVIEKNRKNHDITDKKNHENNLLLTKAINKETMIGIEIVYVDSPPNQIMNVHQKNCLSENKKYQRTVMLR